MKKLRLPAYWNRNFSLYFFGSFASALGGTFSNFCTGLFFLDMTGSAALMSAYIAWTTALSLILTPFMGAVCDRLPKVKVLWVCDYIFSATDLITAALLFSGLTGPTAAAAVFVNGTINCLVSTLFNPAAESMIPMLVDQEHLTPVYSLMTTRGNLTSLLGVPVAAAVYGVAGYPMILLLNGLLVGTSGIFEMFIRANQPMVQFKPNRILKDWTEGLHYLLRIRVLVLVGLIAIPTNFLLTGMFSIAMPYMLNTEFGLDPMVLAICEVGMPIGAIIAATWLGSRKHVRAGTMLPLGFGMIALTIISLFGAYLMMANGHLTTWTFICIIIPLFAILTAATTLTNIPMSTIRAKVIAPEYMGRVTSLFSTVCSAATPVAAIVYGFIIDGPGLSAAYALSAGGILFCLLAILSQRRHFGDL